MISKIEKLGEVEIPFGLYFLTVVGDILLFGPLISFLID
jgi:hypothetical protein